MKAITYRLRLLEPMLVSQAESGEENSAIGLPFVPGSALRGAMAARFLRRFSPTDPATDRNFRRLFLDDTVCFLNAYPWREEGRMLPMPMSWMMEKSGIGIDDTEGEAYDWAVAPDARLEHPKPPLAEFCVVTNGDASLVTPQRQVNVHISLQSVNVRDDKNTVYRYDALAEGEILAGVIVTRESDALKMCQDLLDPREIALGTAQRAGYGRVCIERVSLEEEGWTEYQPVPMSAHGEVVVTLLSDAILRGPAGQVDGEVEGAMAKALGISQLEAIREYRRIRLVGGYNRKWSLPLPQSWAVEMGSVFVFSPDRCDALALRRAVEAGIGERRSEGFGRVAVNWHGEREITWRKAGPPPLEEERLSDTSKALAQRMADRRLRQLLDLKLMEAINRAKTTASRPTNAQLSRVRSAVQQAMVLGTLTPVLDHMQNLKGARQDFEKARIGSVPLLRWIRERAERLDVDIQLLGDMPSLPRVAGQVGVVSEQLKVEYTARLIDGVMKSATKLNQQEEDGR